MTSRLRGSWLTSSSAFELSRTNPIPRGWSPGTRCPVCYESVRRALDARDCVQSAGYALNSNLVEDHIRVPTLGKPYLADRHIGSPWPLSGLLCAVDRPSHLNHAIEAHLPCVALSDGIRGKETYASIHAQDRSCAQEEVSNKVCATPSATCNVANQIFPVIVAERACESLPTRKRRVADDDVEAGSTVS